MTDTTASQTALQIDPRFAQTRSPFSGNDLSRQFNVLLPAIEAHGDELIAAGFVELSDHTRAARQWCGLAEQSLRTMTKARRSLAELRRELMAVKRALISLAKDAGIATQALQVPLPRSGGAKLLASARRLYDTLIDIRPQLAPAALVADLVGELDVLVDEMHAHGDEKVRMRASAAICRQARHALYAYLLRVSRLGTAVFRHRKDVAACFALRHLNAVRRGRATSTTPVAVDKRHDIRHVRMTRRPTGSLHWDACAELPVDERPLATMARLAG